MPRTGEAAGDRVAHDFATDPVDDHDGVARFVERGEQPVLHGLRLQDAIFGFTLLLGDGVDQREIVGDVDGTPHPFQLAARRHELAQHVHGDDPPDQSDDDEQTRHHRGQARRLIRIDR